MVNIWHEIFINSHILSLKDLNHFLFFHNFGLSYIWPFSIWPFPITHIIAIFQLYSMSLAFLMLDHFWGIRLFYFLYSGYLFINAAHVLFVKLHSDLIILTQLQLVGLGVVFPLEEGRRNNLHLAFSRRNDPTCLTLSG